MKNDMARPYVVPQKRIVSAAELRDFPRTAAYRDFSNFLLLTAHAVRGRRVRRALSQ